jgi:cobalamin biosynthesis protein CbiD
MPARSPRTAAAALAALALAGAAAGCGSTSVDDVEKQVGSELKAQLDRSNRNLDEGTPTRVARVDCPDDVDTDEGAMFRCRALGPDGRVAGSVTVQMGKDGDARWQFVAASPQ